MKLLCTFLFVSLSLVAHAQKRATLAPEQKLEARILQLEDERNLNGDELPKLLKHASPVVRHRAIIALGRIGDERGVAPLLDYLEKYKDETGRPLVIFALGEIESVKAFAPLLAEMARHNHLDSDAARAAEALGKIGSVAENIPLIGQDQLERASLAIIKLLPAANEKLSPSQLAAAGWCITALMRLRSPQAVAPLTQQLQSNEAALRAQAANALSRLRLPIAEAVPALLIALNDTETDVRSNAARALGVTKDARAVEPLIKALSDKQQEVVVTAIRSLASLNDQRAFQPLLEHGKREWSATNQTTAASGLLLETVTALVTLNAESSLPFLKEIRSKARTGSQPEIETALGRAGEKIYFEPNSVNLLTDELEPRQFANLAQGLAATKSEMAKELLLMLWMANVLEAPTQPSILRALVRLKPATLPLLLRASLQHQDDGIRAAAAGGLSEYLSDENFLALQLGLEFSRRDSSNDAKLAILSALAKYKTEPAIKAIKTALKDRDILVRRHAVRLLKQLEAGDFSDAIGTVQTGRTAAFYQSVVAQSRQKLFATITTDKGAIKLELFPQDAPLTVNNFVTLARKGYFNGVTFHRVVPNFVIQGGDPRGTGDGGPGYAIRCEVNQRPYGRGTLGMALSGKDTGGSQWFITHAPQPHLDGGYTVFGQVLSGMDVVDRITRDDVMRRIVITNK